MFTAADAGGVVACAVKLTGPASLVNVALTVWRVEPPIESFVVATPLALVVLCVGLTAPPPEATVHVMTTPGTARPSMSTAVTLKAVGSGLLTYQL